MSDAGAPVLLYDGDCGFCSSFVQFVLRHDAGGTLRFAALQGSYGTAALGRHPSLHGLDTVVWLAPGTDGHDEQVLIRSDAALQVARYLGGWWRLALLGRIVPRAIRDRIYDLVARNRRRILPSGPACLNPSAEERQRFIDQQREGSGG